MNKGLNLSHFYLELVIHFKYLEMKARKLIFFYFITYVHLLNAQSPKLPVVLPPTPEAASIAKYSELTGGAYHGGSQASIPLYQIKMKEFSFPISINYASNGLKVDEIPSRVGLGWNLNAGGVITRTVNGKPDDQTTRLLPTVSLSSYSAVHYFYDLIDEGAGYDAEPDEFRISAPGLSGKFVLDTGNHVVLIPYSNLKVDVNFLATSGPYYEFVVTNTEGIKYYFGGAGAIDVTSNHNLSGKLSGFNQVNTGFFLRKMEFLNKDSINFYYSNVAIQNYTGLTHTAYEGVGLWSGSSSCPQAACTIGGASFSESVSDIRYNSRLLDSIRGSDGSRIVFTYGTRPDSGGDKRLTGITITEAEVLKKYSLTYYDQTDNSGCHTVSSFNKRFFLNELKYWAEKNSVATDTLFHKFEYVELSSLPGRLICAQDDYGYYNGKSNTNLLPSGYSSSNFGGYAVADRSSDGAYAVKGLLNKIIYPTGGNDSIIYEPNSSGGPGVRVKQIRSFDPVSSTSNSKYYKYTTLNNLSGSSGLPLYALTYITSAYTATIACDGSSNLYRVCKSDVLSSNSNASQYYYDNNPYVYSAVLESDDPNFRNGVIEHIYEAEALAGYASTVIGDDILYLPTDTYTWHQGYELATNYYDSTLTLIKSINNYYHEDTAVNKTVQGVVVRAKYDWPEPSGTIGTADIAPWDVAQVLYNSQWIKHDSTVIKEYDALSHLVISKTTNFYGTPTNILPSRIETLDSKGLVIKEEFKYPTDSSTTSPYQRMIANNILSPVIETKTSRNNNLINTVANNYYDFSESTSSGYPVIIKPKTIQIKKGTGSFEPRIRFSRYDAKGNINEMSKENDMKLSYIWDYNKYYPIAEVKNADSASIAYTSFEADSKGGWTFSGSLNATYSITGSKSYLVSGGNITKSGLTNTTYIVSYWGRSGSVNVNSSGPTKTGKTIGSWTYYEHEVTTTSITISGSNYIDELRLYPKGAFMISYTYTPLAGITSQSDPAGHIIFYDYDSFNRLKTVKDEDGNILKRMEYKYKGAYQD
jgi:hypothetical protein